MQEMEAALQNQDYVPGPEAAGTEAAMAAAQSNTSALVKTVTIASIPSCISR